MFYLLYGRGLSLPAQKYNNSKGEMLSRNAICHRFLQLRNIFVYVIYCLVVIWFDWPLDIGIACFCDF